MRTVVPFLFGSVWRQVCLSVIFDKWDYAKWQIISREIRNGPKRERFVIKFMIGFKAFPSCKANFFLDETACLTIFWGVKTHEPRIVRRHRWANKYRGIATYIRVPYVRPTDNFHCVRYTTAATEASMPRDGSFRARKS